MDFSKLQGEEKARRTMSLLDRAIHAGRLTALEVKDKATGKPVIVLGDSFEDSKGNVALRPLARLFMGEVEDEVTIPEGAISTKATGPQAALEQAVGMTQAPV